MDTVPHRHHFYQQQEELMAENKILVQIIDHENGDSVLGQDYFASREKAEEFKRI